MMYRNPASAPAHPILDLSMPLFHEIPRLRHGFLGQLSGKDFHISHTCAQALREGAPVPTGKLHRGKNSRGVFPGQFTYNIIHYTIHVYMFRNHLLTPRGQPRISSDQWIGWHGVQVRDGTIIISSGDCHPNIWYSKWGDVYPNNLSHRELVLISQWYLVILQLFAWCLEPEPAVLSDTVWYRRRDHQVTIPLVASCALDKCGSMAQKWEWTPLHQVELLSGCSVESSHLWDNSTPAHPNIDRKVKRKLWRKRNSTTSGKEIKVIYDISI